MIVIRCGRGCADDSCTNQCKKPDHCVLSEEAKKWAAEVERDGEHLTNQLHTNCNAVIRL